MIGKRVEKEPHQLYPYEYTKFRGTWYAMTPNGMLSNLSGHAVMENGDRTITVTPSIRVTGADESGNGITWHGYLTLGVWRTLD